jgi:hypothetical protein
MTTLNAEAVHSIFLDCLYNDDEIKDNKPPEDAVLVQGATISVGFHPERLESHREEIAALLNELPTKFTKEGGGGWSLMSAVVDHKENQWGGQINAQELMMLGIGIKKAEYVLPREMWAILPGSMPYFVIV